MILKSHFCGQNPVLMPAWFRSHFPVPGRGRRAAAHCTGGHFPTQGSQSVSLPWVIPSGGQRSRGKWLSCHSVATVRSKLELDFPAYENLYFSNRLFPTVFFLMLSIFESSYFVLCALLHPCCTCPHFKTHICTSEQASRLWHVLCVFISSKAALGLHDV